MELGRQIRSLAAPLRVRKAFDARGVGVGTGVDSRAGMAKSRKRSDTISTNTSAREEGSTNEHRTGNGENARDRIAVRAYELYLARGGAPGGDFDDWIAAERELIGSNAQQGSDRNE